MTLINCPNCSEEITLKQLRRDINSDAVCCTECEEAYDHAVYEAQVTVYA